MDSARGCSCLSCTNRTSGEEAPTECTEFTEADCGEEPPTDDTDAHRLGGYGIPAIPTLPTQGVQLSPLGFAACQSKSCTNKTKGTYCSVGTLETSAPLKALSHLCRSVKSVGEYRFCSVGALETSAPLENTLTSVQICEIRGRQRLSKQSVGGHPIKH